MIFYSKLILSNLPVVSFYGFLCHRDLLWKHSPVQYWACYDWTNLKIDYTYYDLLWSIRIQPQSVLDKMFKNLMD